MSAKGERFAERLKARMRAEGLRTHDNVKDAGGPSSPILTKLMNAGYDELSSTTASKLEKALRLKPGSATVSFEDDVDLVPLPDSVGGDDEDGDTLLYRRPDELTDEQWRRVKARTRSSVEWEIEQALKDE